MKSWRQALFAALLGLAASTNATGQTQSQPNPVLVHYRAYAAALERGDLTGAETAAAAALAASIARDGDGGSTGVLAINLAQTRLSLGRRGDALEPATRAFAIASAGNSNVDPLLARLVLGRAELTEDRWRQGRERLSAAIEEARALPPLNAETYSAAADLGRWLFSEEQYGGALRAWEVAREMADLAGEGNDYARAEARMGHAAAMSIQAMVYTIDAQARSTDTRLNADASDAFDSADRELLEAQNILGPFAFTPAEDGGLDLTLGQRVYANALAWRTLLRAFAETRGTQYLARRSADFELPRTDSRPLCSVRPVATPRPNFPPGARSAYAVGAVVVRFSVDEVGRVVDSRVAAAIPDRWFRDAVERVAPQWRIERQPDSAPDCRFNPVLFLPVQFYFR